MNNQQKIKSCLHWRCVIEEFDKRRSKGFGYAIGEENEEISELGAYGDFLLFLDTNEEYALYFHPPSKSYFVVVDLYGPWAIDLPAHLFE
tara:strand:- start:1715 stop:1984 length:270 start_codon:yes stop_codon:yes gene_type:complete